MATPFRIEVNSSTGQARADITGLFNNIADLTKRISANPVDWQKILFSTLSPAMLVGDLGRTLQIAIDATMEFENALGSAVSNAAGQFTGNISLISEMAANMTQNLGTPITDNASAIAYLSKTWGDNAGVMNAIIDKVGEASVQTFTNMSTAVQVFSQVLQAWGITSAQDAYKAIDAIVKGVQNGNIPLEKFAATLIQSKAGLSQYHVSVEEASAALSALSTQSGITGEQAISIFSNFASVIDAKVNPKSAALLSNIQGLLPALKKGDLIDALTDLEKYFQKGDTTAAQLGQQIGLIPTNVSILRSVTESSIDAMKKKADELAAKMKTDLTDPLDHALTTVQQTNVEMNKLKGNFTGGVGDTILQMVNSVLSAVNAIMEFTNKMGVGGLGPIAALSPMLDLILAPYASAGNEVVSEIKKNTANVYSLAQSQLTNMFQQAGMTGIGAQSVLQQASGVLQGIGIGQLGLVQNALLYPSQSNISTINNTFGINIAVTAGETSSQISNAIVKALYARFQGVGK